MITLPHPKPPSMAVFPQALRDMALPSVDTMHQRAVLAEGTGYEQWATEAFYVRLVLEQAIVLSQIGRYIYEDAFEASELASEGRQSTNHALKPLQREVMFRAMDVFKQKGRQERLAEARTRRAEKKAAEQGTEVGSNKG